MGNGRRSPVLVIGNAHKSALLVGSTLAYRRNRPSGDQSCGASRSLGDVAEADRLQHRSPLFPGSASRRLAWGDKGHALTIVQPRRVVITGRRVVQKVAPNRDVSSNRMSQLPSPSTTDGEGGGPEGRKSIPMKDAVYGSPTRPRCLPARSTTPVAALCLSRRDRRPCRSPRCSSKPPPLYEGLSATTSVCPVSVNVSRSKR